MRVYLFLAVVGVAGFVLIACSNRAEAPLTRTSAPAAFAPAEREHLAADAENRKAMLDRLQAEANPAQPPPAAPAPRTSTAETRPLAELPKGEHRVLAELPAGMPGLIHGFSPK